MPCALIASGCFRADAHTKPGTAPNAQRPTPSAQGPAGGGQRPAFDGENAFKLLVRQCDFGPRPVGSEAHRKTRDFLIEEMKKYADRTDIQDFPYRSMICTNVIGVFNPQARRSVLLCTHWDTRPRADQEVDPVKKTKPIVGASDGASGTAVLLELARNFKAQHPQVGVVIVFLDGEDYGNFETDQGVFLGSRYFADHHDRYNPEFGVLLDMVGDRDLNIKREQNSQEFAPGTNTKVFAIARELGYGDKIIDQNGYQITDDHIALSRRGHIPTIDLIDFDYGPWHTLDDTPDKCSAQSLAVVGNTLAELIYREKDR